MARNKAQCPYSFNHFTKKSIPHFKNHLRTYFWCFLEAIVKKVCTIASKDLVHNVTKLCSCPAIL